MKKVILCAGALLFGSFAIAQVSSTPVPTVVTPQTAFDGVPSNTDGNYGEGIQNGNNHKVRVRQAGVNNSVYTNQSDGDTSGGNLADVIQTGAVGTMSGDANAAETRQTGSVNQSTTRQQGDGNLAQTLQGQINASSNANLASIQQGNNNNAEDNEAMVQQDGEANEANIFQTYDNNDGFIVQEGDMNESSIRQIANPNASPGHYAINDQEGDENDSKIIQSGEARQQAYAMQLGDRNQSYQVQNSNGDTGLVAADGNTGLVNQGVETEYGTVRAVYGPILRDDVDDWTEGGSNGSGSYGADAYQLQTGQRNNGEIHQYGQVNGTDSQNAAGQEQHGSDSQALIVQNAYGTETGGQNYAYQIQTEASSGNVSALAQNGNGHKGFQWQNGTNSQVLSTQRGEDNKMSTYQTGDLNYIETAQRGQDNIVLITQESDGNSYVANQNLPNGTPVGFPNGGNEIDVYQTGPGTGMFAGPNPNQCEFDNVVMTMAPTDPDSPVNYEICPDC